MSWSVLEQHVVPANQVRGPEDGIFIVDTVDGFRVIMVADAHSSFVTESICDRTPGQFALWAFSNALHAVPIGDNLCEWVHRLGAYVQGGLIKAGRFEEQGCLQHLYRRPGLVFAAFIPHLGKIVRVGDCQYFVDGKGENPGLAVDRQKTARRRRFILNLFQQSGASDLLDVASLRQELLRFDPTQDLMRRLTLHWQHAFRNKSGSEWGYGVVDGTAVPTEHIEIISVPRSTEVVTLTSDGVPPAVVHHTSFDATMETFTAALAQDPLCIGKVMGGVRGAVLGPEGELLPYDDITFLSVRTS